jgi:enoyl-CoA hydratase/carnithine racemase
MYGPLHDLVGGSVARDLALTGRRVDMPEALATGLVNRVAEPADVDGARDQLLSQVCGAPREILLRTKAKIIARAGIQLRPTLEL